MITYKHLLATAFFIFISAVAFAQEHTFKMDTVFNPVKQASYGKLRVVDMRTNKDNIGDLKTGALNKAKPIVTDKPLDEFLSSYYERMLTGTRNKDIELLLVLHGFDIEDRANGGEIGTFYFDGDFFGGYNGKYTFLGKVDSIYESTSGWDVTKTLLRATKLKTSAMLAGYASQRLKKDYDLTEQQALKRRELHKTVYPIYQTTDFKKGIYYTVEQFLNNAPVDTPFIKSVQEPWDGKKQTYFYYPNSKGKKGKPVKRDTYFAIYDGKDWCVPGHFYATPMRFKNGEFYANVEFRGLADKAQTAGAAGVGGLVGGVIGGVVAAAVADAAYGAGTTWGVYRSRFDPEIKAFVPQERLY